MRDVENFDPGKVNQCVFPSCFSKSLIRLQASANYEKIAAGLSQALLEISEAVDACVKECTLFATETMGRYIANMYAHIFFFLRGAIQWFTRKSIRRVLSSFQEDFYEHFEDQITNIKRISATIKRESQHASNAETRYLRLSLEKFEEDMVIGLQGLERETAERRYQEVKASEERRKEGDTTRLLIQEQSKKLEQFVARGIKALLVGQASQFIDTQQVRTLAGSGLTQGGSFLLSDDPLAAQYQGSVTHAWYATIS